MDVQSNLNIVRSQETLKAQPTLPDNCAKTPHLDPTTLSTLQQNPEPGFFSKMWSCIKYPFEKLWACTKWLFCCCGLFGKSTDNASSSGANPARPTDPGLDLLDEIEQDHEGAAANCSKDVKGFLPKWISCVLNHYNLLSDKKTSIDTFIKSFADLKPNLNPGADEETVQAFSLDLFNGTDLTDKKANIFVWMHTHIPVFTRALKGASNKVAAALSEGSSKAVQQLLPFFRDFLPALAEYCETNPDKCKDFVADYFRERTAPLKALEFLMKQEEVKSLIGYDAVTEMMDKKDSERDLLEALADDLLHKANQFELPQSIGDTLHASSLSELFSAHLFAELKPEEIDEILKMIGTEHPLMTTFLETLRSVPPNENRAQAIGYLFNLYQLLT